MDLNQLKDMILVALASTAGLYVANQLRLLVESVQELNISVAEILEKLSSQDQRIKRLEDKVD